MKIMIILQFIKTMASKHLFRWRNNEHFQVSAVAKHLIILKSQIFMNKYLTNQTDLVHNSLSLSYKSKQQEFIIETQSVRRYEN